MYRIYLSLISFTLLMAPMAATQAARKQTPTEVISNISYVKQKGANAIRLDFEFPISYVSHFPTNSGETITINLRFNRAEIDTSQLPLLQSLSAPDSGNIPLTEVTYQTDSNEPQIIVKFSKEVRFNISQRSGISSLLISLPELVGSTAKGKDKALDLPALIKGSKGEKGRAERMFLAGRKALRENDNSAAIQIFSALLGMTNHPYSKESLELLGLARERNGQQAHAKSAYSEYLERYGSEAYLAEVAKDKAEKERREKDAQRVKQRLADLVSVRVQPKQRLKKTESSKRKSKDSSTFLGSISQYFDFAEKTNADTDGPSETSTATLENQLSFDWRVKSGNYDVRTTFFGTVDYDTIAEADEKSTKSLISSFYSQMKNSTDGIYATVGRQSARTTGISGKFDGVILGYDMSPKVRINTGYGYAVGTGDEKYKVLVDRPFVILNLEMNDLIKGWDISPYVSQENIFGHINRQVIGTDIRLFHKNGDVYGIYEYDQYFKKTTFFRLQTKYSYQKDTTLNLTYEKRTNPFMSLENALLGADYGDDTIETILTKNPGVTVDDLRDRALEKTGESTSLTVGVSHSFSDTLHLTFTSSDSKALTKSVPTPNPSPGILDDTIDDIDSFYKDKALQLVTSASFHPQDSTIIGLRNSESDNFKENSVSFEYRRPYNTKLRITSRIQYRIRDNTSTKSTTDKTIPSVKLNYRASRDLRWYAEISYNNERTVPDESTNPTVDQFLEETVAQDFSIYGGYSLNF